jgi:O-antigen ligase
MSLHLVAEKPLTGWGIPGAQAELSSQDAAQWTNEVIKDAHGEYGGAHNDALQMMIQSGVWGLAAYLLLLLVPLGVFLRRRLKTTGDTRLACELGACLVVGVMVGGLTNELLSLKYLASFYSITIAGLAAQVLAQQNPTSTDEVSTS